MKCSLTALLLLPAVLPIAALAAEPGRAAAGLDPMAILGTIVYGLIGIALALVGYKAYEWMVPFDLNKEIEVDQNPAVGLVLGAVIIGVSIIVAASIV